MHWCCVGRHVSPGALGGCSYLFVLRVDLMPELSALCMMLLCECMKESPRFGVGGSRRSGHGGGHGSGGSVSRCAAAVSAVLLPPPMAPSKCLAVLACTWTTLELAVVFSLSLGLWCTPRPSALLKRIAGLLRSSPSAQPPSVEPAPATGAAAGAATAEPPASEPSASTTQLLSPGFEPSAGALGAHALDALPSEVKRRRRRPLRCHRPTPPCARLMLGLCTT